MKTLHTAWSILCLLVLMSLPLSAQQAERVYTPELIPNVQLADSTRLVSDPAGYLTSQQTEELDASLRDIRHRYGVEYVIVLVPSIGERDIEGFSTELFRLWGLGAKKDNNGLLLLVAMEQNQMRFEVGYGLEGDLTDATASQIWRRDMVPHFRSGDYAEGLRAGVASVADVLEESQWRSDGSRPTSRRESESDGWMLLKLFFLFGFGVSLISMSILHSSVKQIRTPLVARQRLPALRSQISSTLWMLLFLCLPMALVALVWRRWALRRLERLSRLCPSCHEEAMMATETGQQLQPYLTPYQRIEQRLGSVRFVLYKCSSCQHGEVVASPVASSPYKPCPVCNSRALQRTGQRRLRTPQGYIVLRTDYLCLSCDHTIHQDQRDDDDGLMQAAAIGTILGIGRSMTRGGFGGGFGGGGFGGGSSGGGGFTGRW